MSESGDVCPTLAGSSKAPLSRGCPDSDADGYMDNVDAFPENPFQWNDTDEDGYGDNNAVSGGDSCVNEYGRSNQSGRLGCPDADFDGWADDIDVFPDDGLQWVDSDGDGYGDNYVYEVVSVEDEDNPGMFLMLREEQGDAFPNDVTQWSDRDGDGRGDNPTGNLPDAFPLRVSQQLDFDGDGYGDNITLDAYQSDGCRKIFGTSTDDTYGCPDADDDGTSDDADPCPYDPSIEVGVRGQVTCTITAPQDDGDGDAASAVATSAPKLTRSPSCWSVLWAHACGRGAGDDRPQRWPEGGPWRPGERKAVQRGLQRRRRAPARVDQLLRGTGSTRRSEGTRLDRPRRGRPGAAMATIRATASRCPTFGHAEHA